MKLPSRCLRDSFLAQLRLGLRSGCRFVFLFGLCLSEMSLPLRLAFPKRKEGDGTGQESGTCLPGGQLSSLPPGQHLRVPRMKLLPLHRCWLELRAGGPTGPVPGGDWAGR